MTHLNMEQLVSLSEPGYQPGTAAARDHLESCGICQAELDRLHQRVARMRALPTLRPPRDRFPRIRTELEAARKQSLRRRGVLSGLAVAASIALAVLFYDGSMRDEGFAPSPTTATAGELEEVIFRSQQLERLLMALEPDQRVLDSRTATITSRLEDRLQVIDRDLQAATVVVSPGSSQKQLRLWRERVGLLDALVDVHVTRASYAGL